MESRDAEAKEILKIKKALREIDALEERRVAGERLQGNQLRKIEKGTEYRERLRELEELVETRQQQQQQPQLPPQQLPSEGMASGLPPPSQPWPQPERWPPAAAPAPAAPMCRHFLAGRCSFGDACRNSHAVDVVPAGAARGPPQRAVPRPQEPAFDAEDPECGICFDSIRRKGERFGMLESCDHAFCLTCIRSWRKQREQQDRHNLRLCPVCRNESYFVVPCDDIMLDSEEKRRAINAYKAEMGLIPCKLFDYGKGSCSFGTSCFYAHLNPDGTRYVPPALRWRNGADGSEVIGEVKLSDFLVRSLALP